MQLILTEEVEDRTMEPLIEVKKLRTHFFLNDGVVKAVNGLDFIVYEGKSLGIVGESGCGKSVTAQSIMRLVPNPPGRIVEGEILYRTNRGIVDIAKLKRNGRKMRALRGAEISMIFQEPMNSLSPVHTIGNQIIESIRLHQKVTKAVAKEIALDTIYKVRIPRPDKVMNEYPHSLSGGMRQRAMIALALCCGPSLLIADEPTTALDVTVQAQILRLIKDLQEDSQMGLILITHNLRIIAQTADTVAIVYLGKVVEYGGVLEVFEHPLHPYTKALFTSIPKLEGKQKLTPIKGSVPDPYEIVKGCPFRTRCSERIKMCDRDDVPAMCQAGTDHMVRCYLYTKEHEEEKS